MLSADSLRLWFAACAFFFSSAAVCVAITWFLSSITSSASGSSVDCDPGMYGNWGVSTGRAISALAAPFISTRRSRTIQQERYHVYEKRRFTRMAKRYRKCASDDSDASLATCESARTLPLSPASDGEDTLRGRGTSCGLISKTRVKWSGVCSSMRQPTMLRLPSTTRSAPRVESCGGTDFIRR